MTISETVVGEVRLFAFDRTPVGWLPCDGRVVSVAEYIHLFSVLGLEMTENGIFTLPKLQAPEGLFYCICHDGAYPSSEDLKRIRARLQ
jgi:hypothetical protein